LGPTLNATVDPESSPVAVRGDVVVGVAVVADGGTAQLATTKMVDKIPKAVCMLRLLIIGSRTKATASGS
jgi:hypothetical protein